MKKGRIRASETSLAVRRITEPRASGEIILAIYGGDMLEAYNGTHSFVKGLCDLFYSKYQYHIGL